ncbi:MAG: peptidyl-prolyl cis-trans isomerase [Planctomycetota bacterium]|nr:MAG: peptidyl-prolyl cis-trans isomerase [Planctomycetota bacterium]
MAGPDRTRQPRRPPASGSVPDLPQDPGPALGHLPLMRRTAALLLAAASGCAAPAGPRPGAPGVLPGIVVAGRVLDARAWAAESVFLFPEESRALTRSLLRAELARREARRLGIVAPAAAVAEALAAARRGLAAEVGEEGFDAWARRRYGRSGAEVEAVIRRHLEANLLYQLALRAESAVSGGHRVHLLVVADRDQAERLAERLRQGADPKALAAETADPELARSESDLPVWLPEPLASALADLGPGGVAGPLRLPGDRSWTVVRYLARRPPAAQPPVEVLLDGLAARPIGALEARAWYEEMLRRYTARDTLPAIQAPEPAFVRPERP